MKKLWIIGIGAGDPDYLTLQAIRAMNEVDVFFIPDKGTGKQDLNRIRKDICEQVISHPNYRMVDFQMPPRQIDHADYAQSIRQWHADLDRTYSALISEQLTEHQHGAFLVWGDPALYDGTIHLLAAIQRRLGDFDYEVIPGISSIQALAAKHKTSLNRIGENILITPGRKLPALIPEEIDNTLVMLDGHANLARLVDQNLYIYWGANLGTKQEVLIEGRLPEVLAQIETTRQRIKLEHGWVMDCSLIRRNDELPN